ncbi:DUF6760 family protein [Streptomyces netropsis]
MTHPADRLYEEITYIAYHFHWGHASLLGLTHHERRRWVRSIAAVHHSLSNDQPTRR